MVEFPVKYRLYDSAGSSLVYTFPFVQRDNSPQDPKAFVEIEGLRGQGSIIIPGSNSPWNLVLDFLIQGDDYQAIIAAMDSLESTIVMQTKYVLKIDRTTSTTKNYNVMRLQPFVFTTQDFRTDIVEVSATFRVNSW